MKAIYSAVWPRLHVYWSITARLYGLPAIISAFRKISITHMVDDIDTPSSASLLETNNIGLALLPELFEIWYNFWCDARTGCSHVIVSL